MTLRLSYLHAYLCYYRWNYLGYLAALKLGDPDEFTGLEQYVYDLVFEENSRCAPFGYVSLDNDLGA